MAIEGLIGQIDTTQGLIRPNQGSIRSNRDRWLWWQRLVVLADDYGGGRDRFDSDTKFDAAQKSI